MIISLEEAFALLNKWKEESGGGTRNRPFAAQSGSGKAGWLSYFPVNAGSIRVITAR